MKNLIKISILATTLLFHMACSSEGNSDNNTTIQKYDIKTLKSVYKPDEIVSVYVDMNLSGDKDWVGIFPKGSTNGWGNVIKWNLVTSKGEVALSKVDYVAHPDMPVGEYEVRIFYHNESGADVVEKAKYAFWVSENYLYPVDTKLTYKATQYLPRPEKTAFEDISQASVVDPSSGATITRMHANGPHGYSGYLYPKSTFWNADMSLLYLGYRFFNADKLTESSITKGLTTSEAFAKLGSPVGNTFKWSHVNPNIFYTLQGQNRADNKFTFTKNTIDGDAVTHEVIFDFQKERFEKVLLGNGEGHIDRYDKNVLFVGKKADNDHVFALLCNIQKPEDECKIKEIEESTWGSVYIKDSQGTYNERALFDWIDISPNGNHIVVNKTVNGAEFVNKKLDSVETAIYLYDMNFENEEKLTNLAGHGDIGLAENGDRVYVQFEWKKGGIIAYNLDAPADKRETKLLSGYHGGGHISCQNFNRPGWCYVSSSQEGYNEVFALKLDGSETVNRFVQARSTSGPYAGVSPDGKRVVFVSNWADDNKSQFTMYHAAIKEKE